MISVKWLSASLLIIAGGLAPQSPGQLSTESGSSEVAGVVVSEQTGEPLASARISIGLLSKNRRFAVTNQTGPNGRFHFKNVPPGRYAVTASKPGYVSRPMSRQEVEAGEGERIEGVNVTLWKAAAISGAIRDSNGEPVPRIEVHALEKRLRRGGDALISVARAVTDDRGAYRLHGLESGDFIIGALPPQIATLRGQARFRAAAYYPNAGRAAEAAPLSVAWGEDRPAVDFEWQDRSRLIASGVVRTDDGPCDSCEMTIIPSSQPLFEDQLVRFSSRQDGRFFVEHLVPGSYLVLAQGRAETTERLGRVEFSIVDQSVHGKELLISPGGNVVGTIVLDDAPTAVNLAGLRVHLSPLDPPVFWPDRDAGVQRDSGTFRIENVPGGSYELTLRPLPPGGYLKEVKVGGRRLTEPGFAAADAGDTTNVEVVIGFDGGTVSGRVETGAGGPPCRVGLIPTTQGNTYLRERWEQCDASGAFRFDAVAPGEYLAVAVTGDLSPTPADTAQLSALRRNGRAVDVEPRGQIQIDLKAHRSSR